jgi:hypothetical protein
MRLRLAVSSFASAVLCLGSALAQSVMPPQPGPADPRIVHVDRLCVKLAEGTGAELRNGALHSRTGTDLSALASAFAAGHAAPLITAVDWDELDRWHAHACAVLPEHNRPGHLGLWFRLTGENAAATAQLFADLVHEPLVAHVHYAPVLGLCSATPPPTGAAPPAPPQDIPPQTPRFTSQQFSHASNAAGHAIREASGMLGARGAGVRFVMMETSWFFGHEDVEQLLPTAVLGPVPVADPATAHHGLSGAAIVSGTRNSYGLTGVADEVDARFMAVDLNGGIENSLAFAVTQSVPGDVFLVVMAIQVPYLGPGSWVPFEFVQSAFDATLTTTALGRHVVVPAGNGNRSLDDPALLNRFDRSSRDSGAVVVASSQAGLFQRAPYSNWGSRVDAHSWGDQVISCGYGTLFFPNNDIQQAYTAGATGTSSSTPHLAGIVCQLQGAAKRQTGQPLTNQQVVALLHAHGATTPDIIGRRPDVVQMLQALGLYDGLRVDAPDLDLLQTMNVTMSGPTSSIAALFASFATGDFDLGFNRHVHLDLFGCVSLGAFVLPVGAATWSLQVPNNAALHGADLYFQAVRLTGTNPMHVTNSCQVTIL